MSEVLILRLDAPLMSFGGVVIDGAHPTERFPGRSFLAGLIGNALGLEYCDFAALEGLQDALTFASRWDRAPKPLIDYQTVDLGSPKMGGKVLRNGRLVQTRGWTTAGRLEKRKTGNAEATHQMRVAYWADGIHTVALELSESAPVSLSQVVEAFQTPARPLYFGRKTCVPAAPILLAGESATVEATHVLDALRRLPLAPGCEGRTFEACWPAGLAAAPQGARVLRYETMNPRTRAYVGLTQRVQGVVELLS